MCVFSGHCVGVFESDNDSGVYVVCDSDFGCVLSVVVAVVVGIYFPKHCTTGRMT